MFIFMNVFAIFITKALHEFLIVFFFHLFLQKGHKESSIVSSKAIEKSYFRVKGVKKEEKGNIFL